MDRKIKLIWDFHGGHAKGTADHHSIHLGEYATREKVSSHGNGVEQLTEMHSIAYLIVDEKDMIIVRDALKPQRAELAE
jgi:hypothetical protein